MRISYGTSRVVIALPQYSIAIKLPIIRVVRALRHLPGYIKRFHVWKRASLESSTVVTPPGLVLKGIVQNLGERRFYKRTKHPLLQPTLFSFFGLLNIQRYGVPLEGMGLQIADTIWKISNYDDERVGEDSHHFTSSKNFTKDETGKIRMLDYGFKKTQEVINLYGKRLHDEFIFPQTGHE